MTTFEEARKANKDASLRVLEHSGGYAITAKKGQKEALNLKDGKATINEDFHKQRLREISNPAFEDNLGIITHSDLVDIDVDTDVEKYPQVLEALDVYLPRCKHIWGRKSKPNTHRLYKLVADGKPLAEVDRSCFPVLKRIEKILHIEFRNCQKGGKSYSALPGSVHPSGELVQWKNLHSASEGLVKVDIFSFVDDLRQAAAATLLAPYWIEGTRNDLTMAMSGFLYRLSVLAQESASNGQMPYYLDKERARSFLQKLLTIAGDTEVYQRMKTFDLTWNKAEQENIPVTAGKTLVKITDDPKLLRNLYSVMSDNEDAALIEEFLGRFCVLTGRETVVDLERLGREGYVMSRAGFVASFSSEYRYTNAKGESKPLPRRFFDMPAIQKVGGLALEPEGAKLVDRAGEQWVNMWSGWEIPPHEFPVTDEDVEPFITYVREVLSSGDPDTYEWIMDWLANLFQQPSKKYGTCLVLTGKPGTGKSFLHQCVIGPILGESLYVPNYDIPTITSNFNIMYAGKLLIGCDEATSHRQRHQFEKMKTLITDIKMRVEPKGKDAFHIENLTRYILTSNHDVEAIHLPDGAADRRYTILRVSNVHRNDRDWWQEFASWLDADNNRAKIHRWLKQWELTGKARLPLRTEARIATGLLSAPVFDRWLAEAVDRGHPLHPSIHQNAWDAATERSTASITSQSHSVNRSEWPSLISFDAVVADIDRFIRQSSSYADTRDGKKANHQIGEDLKTRGLRPDESPYQYRVPKGKICHRTETEVGGTKVRLHPWPTYEEVCEYLKEAYGHEPIIDQPFTDEKENENVVAFKGKDLNHNEEPLEF